MPIASINPATGRLVRVFEEYSETLVEAALARAASAAVAWRHTTVATRAGMLARVGDKLDADRERLAALATLEMGKTLQSARDELTKCALACRHYAMHAAAMLEPERAEIDGATATLRLQPLGVVLAVMPWNFPFWQVIRAAAPALAAGNVILLKHASNVPQCALALEELFLPAHTPERIVQTLLIGSSRVGSLVADRRVAAVTLTGSDAAGRDVASRAGRAIKRTVLELGGSDPFIVLRSADVPAAAAAAVKARMINNGQSCIAAKRFVVDEAVGDEFEQRFVDGVRALRVGDPMDPATDVGPLATEQIRRELTSQLERSVARGARVLIGGHPLDGPGWFFAPTVCGDVPLDAAIATEEVFGPVAPIFRVPDTAAAIALANATPFGLGASVWTRDAEEAARCVEEVDAGMVFVNAMVASDPRFPFGGVKESGYGREVGDAGLREFVNLKTVRGSAAG